MPPPTIETDRLVLRPMVEDDAEAMWHVFSDDELMRYWSSPPHRSIEETRTYVATNARQDVYLTWAITERGGEALGHVALTERRPGVGEIGYSLRRSHWGRGYAREAVGGIVRHAFGEGGYRRLLADTDPDNEPSNRLLEDLGFRREGLLREEWETHIGVRDSIIWGLLRREWEG